MAVNYPGLDKRCNRCGSTRLGRLNCKNCGKGLENETDENKTL